MSEFRHWLQLDEAVKLIQAQLHSHQIVNLGKYGWWTVYSALETPNPPGRVLSLDEFRKMLYQGGGVVRDDDLVDSHPNIAGQLREVFEDAAYQLGSLGFPRMHQVALIINLNKETNRITGRTGDVGGYAFDKGHGMAIGLGELYTTTVVHEHAHMYWFNLPKANKEYFKRYYKDVVLKSVEPKDAWKHSNTKDEFPSDKIEEAIRNNVYDFIHGLPRAINGSERGNDLSIQNWFLLRKAIEDDDKNAIIKYACLRRQGTFCNAKLLQDLPMSSSYGTYDAKKGEVVLVEKGSTGYIVLNTGERRYEHKNVLDDEQIDATVKFDESLLQPHHKEIYDNSMQWMAKKKPSQFFAPSTRKKEINDLFSKIQGDVVRHYRGKSGSTFGVDQVFMRKNPYSTWVSIIGRRFKAGKITDIKGIIEAYVDTLMKSVNSSHKEETPENIKGFNSPHHWDTPESEPWRTAAHAKQLTPSPYGAANVDELWATAVENAAGGKFVPPDLKKLIYNTIRGGAG